MIVRPVLCRPFIGRRDELAYLHERRLEAASSRGGLVLIVGDAGVGKSRLIATFADSIEHSRWRVAGAACDESASRPYGPLLDVLASMEARPFELESAGTKREQHDAIVARFAEFARRRALCVTIEDVHWADAATLELLAYLGSRLHGLRLLVLVSSRPPGIGPEDPGDVAIAKLARQARAGRIDLGPLRGSELHTFIDGALAGRSLPDETRRAIAIAGEGNPFFTEELLKSAVESSAHAPAQRGKRALPATLRTTLLERLHLFDRDERRVIGQAAVIGRRFGLDLLASTLDVDPERALPALRRARDVQLVEEVEGGAFRFRHGLTRDAIYGEFLEAEARPRHRAIALALEAAPSERRSVEALAYHWWAAGDGPNGARYNEAAGDAAARVHAHDDAIAFYERALEASHLASAERAVLGEKIAGCRVALGSIAEANAAFGAAADAFREAADFAREAACRTRAAIFAYTAGLREPTAPLEAMLERLDPSEHLARTHVHLGLAWVYKTLGFPSRAAVHLAQIDARARAADLDVERRYRNCAAGIAMSQGDIAAFRREYAGWIAAAEKLGTVAARVGALVNGGLWYSYLACWNDALEQLAQAKRIARDARFAHGAECAAAVEAMTHLLRGELERARTALDGVSTSSESRINIAFATAWGTMIGAHTADRELVEKWFDGFESTILAAPEPECGAGFAEILHRRGRERDAAAFLRRALRDCESQRGTVLTLLAAGRYGAEPERIRARAFLALAAACTDDVPERPALALVDAWERARSGSAGESRSLALEAAAGFARLGMPLLEAAALEAAQDVEGALALYRRCGARYDVARLEPLRGVPVSNAAVVPSAVDALSRREREIAALAAAGISNIEIASRLSIARQTVEKHLAAAYRKLGIASRAELGAVVAAARPR